MLLAYDDNYKKSLVEKVETSTVMVPNAIYAPLVSTQGRTKQFPVTQKG